MIKNAFIRIVDSETQKEMLRYNLSENYDGMTALIFGEIYRKEGQWKFNAIGQPTQDNSLSALIARYS
jgi:stress response protein SCP2